LTPESGELLWEFPWKTTYDVNASQPLVIGDNRVFISTGYGTGAAVIELTRTGDRFSVREVWRNIRMKNQFTSSVLHDGYIYGLDEAILACVDAGTGELQWKGGRYGYGQVMLAGGHLIVADRGRPAGARPCHAGRAPGDRPAVPRDRGQDLEPPGHGLRLPAHPEHQRDGRLRPAASVKSLAGPGEIV
jgi:hypothetical protein